MRIRHAFRLAGLLAYMLAATPAAADRLLHGLHDYPFISAAYTILPSANFEAAGTSSEVQAKESQLALGLVQFDLGESKLNLGIDYQYTRYAYESIDGRNRDLHRLQLPLGFNRRGETWSLAGFVAPGIATSSNVLKDYFNRGSGDDFIVTGRLESSISISQRLDVLGGLAYDRAFGSAKPYPVIGLLYQPGDDIALRLAFPDSAIRYEISSRQRLSLRLFPAGFEWHVAGDQFDYDFDYEVEAIRLQAIWSYRFYRSALLDLSLGYEFNRKHRFVDDTGRIIDSKVDSQLHLSLGFRWGDGPIPYTNEVAW